MIFLNNMCIVCEAKSEGKILEGQILDISDCKTVTEIPVIKGLKRLYVINCPNLVKNMNVDLFILQVWRCPLDISNIRTLTGLSVGYCEYTSLPAIEGLTHLHGVKCPNLTRIRSIEVRDINIIGCGRLRHVPISHDAKYDGCPLVGLSVIGSIFFRVRNFRF